MTHLAPCSACARPEPAGNCSWSERILDADRERRLYEQDEPGLSLDPRSDDQRLGGARHIDPSLVPCPPGFRAEAIAAGFTQPCALATDGAGRLYVVERGSTRRTPPRLLRVNVATGATTVLGELPYEAASSNTSLAVVDDEPVLGAGERLWRLDDSGSLAATASRTTGAPVFGGLAMLPGAWVSAEGELYFCDPGRQAAGQNPDDPWLGIVWRVSREQPVAPLPLLPRARAAALRAVPPSPATGRLRFVIAVMAVALAAGLALLLFQRRDRSAAV